jgi:predicted dithiol-disulfide oxidoreductase (DUF899 family)
MNNRIVSQNEWLKARIALLEEEKALTRQSDAIAQRRQELPWVRIEKAYRFDTEAGPASLAELFRGRSQLIVYHFMFGPDFAAGCTSCSSVADGFNGNVAHLRNHDVMFWAISRAPLDKLQAYRKRMGWTFPWASSGGSDFNMDFSVSFTDRQQSEGGADYNYRPCPPATFKGETGMIGEIASMSGTDAATYMREKPGMSAFAIEDGVVYHTYSAYSRGLDGLWGVYQWLDRAPKGRNEQGFWQRRHDEYAEA